MKIKLVSDNESTSIHSGLDAAACGERGGVVRLVAARSSDFDFEA